VPGRRHRFRAALTAFVAATTLAGCVGAIDRSDFDDEIKRRGGGLTSDLTVDAFAALGERTGATDPELLHLTISLPSRVVSFEARDPQRRDQVDGYTFRGGDLSDGDPVQVTGSEPLEARTFRASELPALTDLESLADEALAALGFADSYVSSVGVWGTTNPPEITLSVESPRSRGSVRFTGDGTLIEAVRQ
jgi:hypothetical protein